MNEAEIRTGGSARVDSDRECAQSVAADRPYAPSDMRRDVILNGGVCRKCASSPVWRHGIYEYVGDRFGNGGNSAMQSLWRDGSLVYLEVLRLDGQRGEELYLKLEEEGRNDDELVYEFWEVGETSSFMPTRDTVRL